MIAVEGGTHRIETPQAQIHDEQHKISVIVEADAVVHPWTVMVHLQHTPADQGAILRRQCMPESCGARPHTQPGSLTVGEERAFLQEPDRRMAGRGDSQLAYVAVVGQGGLCPPAGLTEPHIRPRGQVVAL